MRQLTHKLIVVSLVVVACSDNQQPTSPVSSRSASRDAALTQGAQQNSKPQPGPVAFTKIEVYYGPQVTITAGAAGGATVQCPAGSAPTGGGFDLYTSGGTAPLLHNSLPLTTVGNGANGWQTAADNTQPGAAPIFLQAWVVCAS